MIFRRFQKNLLTSLFQFNMSNKSFEIRGSIEQNNIYFHNKEIGVFGWMSSDQKEFVKLEKFDTLFDPKLTSASNWDERVEKYFKFHFRRKYNKKEKEIIYSKDELLNGLVSELKFRQKGQYLSEKGIIFENVRHRKRTGDYILFLENDQIVINTIEIQADCTTCGTVDFDERTKDVAYRSKNIKEEKWFWSASYHYHKDQNYSGTLTHAISQWREELCEV